MSALTDIFQGNWGNVGHDLTAHPLQDLGYGAAAAATAFAAPYLLPELGAGLGALGLTGAGEAVTGLGTGIGALESGIGSAIGGALGIGGDAAAAGGGAAALDSFAAVPGATADVGALSAAAPAASGAAAFSAPTGVSSAFGADPTASLNSFDAFPGATAFNAGSGGGGATLGSDVGGGAASGGGGFFNSLLKGITPDLSKPGGLIGPAIAGGGLAYNIAQGQKNSAAVNALGDLASQQGKLGAQLEGYLTTGTLPPGLQASVKQATDAAKARAISNAASQGLSTDPTKNTALAQTLASIDQQIPIITAKIGEELLSTGVTASGLASNVYAQLANIDQTQTANIGRSIASMAAALSGKTSIPGTNLQVSAGG